MALEMDRIIRSGGRSTSGKTSAITRLFFALVVGPLFLVFPYLATVNNPNENVRVYMTMALVDHHTLAIDDEIATFGWTNDSAKVPLRDGTFKHVSVKGPANSLLGMPAYVAFEVGSKLLGHPRPVPSDPPEVRAAWLRNATWCLRLFSVQFPCFLFLLFFERWSRAYVRDTGIRLATTAALALGTNFLGYSQMFVSHALEAVTMFTAFALVDRELRRTGNRPDRTSPRLAFLVGFLVGAQVVLEYHALPTACVLALFAAYTFRKPKLLAAFAVGGAIDVAVMMLFQYFAYGDPLMPGHRMVEDPALAEWHHRGLFGIALPDPEHFALLAGSPTFGFFGTSPFMMLALLVVPFGLLTPLPAHKSATRARLVVAVWLVAMLVLWLAVSAAAPWRGGWTVGPRLLGGVAPFFAFGVGAALDRLARRGRLVRASVRGAAVGLALASVASIGFVSLVYNGMPENVSRPLVQFALPLARAGFVAHHVFEWFGATSVRPWYLPVVCLFLAPLVALVPSRRDDGRAVAVMLASFAIALGIGMIPALSGGVEADVRRIDLRWFASIWEPSGRDAASVLARSNDPCRMHKRAVVFGRLGLEAEASREQELARTRETNCR